jgi:glycine/D-amino acid oxidase-like deaminating enzyme
MSTSLPSSVQTLVIGAGIHGLSTAWHAARRGHDVVVLDKTGVGAGASGIACGIVRNNYFQPAMQELMASCVEIWESEAAALHYHPNGYIALGATGQEDDLTAVFERQQQIGYPSELHLGDDAVRTHMESLYPDWRAPGLSVCLHERAGGYGFNKESMRGLAELATGAGARILSGIEVTGFALDGSGAVTRVQTSYGAIDVEQVVVAVGPWIPQLWSMLQLPDRLDVTGPEGSTAPDQPTWTYWYLQEGEVAFDPSTLVCADGTPSPVLHVDSDQPLHAADGSLVTDELWGVYFKPDRETVQGGAEPLAVGPDFTVDPYPTGTVDPGFPRMWSSALSHCLGRFEGAEARYRQTRSGGVGAFTVDNFPVFDRMRPNVIVAADSNHGFKMIAVGREIARMLDGELSSLLYPFRYERFATGDLHPVSHSPYPWS